MSLFKSLFPTLAEVQELTAKNEKLEKKVESRDETIEDLRKQRQAIELQHERQQSSLVYTHGRQLKELQDENKFAASRHERDLAFSIDDAAIVAENISCRADIRVEEAGIEARAEVKKEVEALTKQRDEALVAEAFAVAEAESKDTVIESLTAQIENYYDLVTFISTKIPDVDLTKFNINVDVKPVDVIVNGVREVKKS